MNAQNKLIFAVALLLVMLSVAQANGEAETLLESLMKQYNSIKFSQDDMSVVEKFGTMVAKNHVNNFEKLISTKITPDYVEICRENLHHQDESEENNVYNPAKQVSDAISYFNETDMKNFVKEFEIKEELLALPDKEKLKKFAELLYDKVEIPCDNYWKESMMVFDNLKGYVEGNQFTKDLERLGDKDEVKQFFRNFASYLVCYRLRDSIDYMYRS